MSKPVPRLLRLPRVIPAVEAEALHTLLHRLSFEDVRRLCDSDSEAYRLIDTAAKFRRLIESAKEVTAPPLTSEKLTFHWRLEDGGFYSGRELWLKGALVFFFSLDGLYEMEEWPEETLEPLAGKEQVYAAWLQAGAPDEDLGEYKG